VKWETQKADAWEAVMVEMSVVGLERSKRLMKNSTQKG
jgi:hypothetical protein